MKRNWRKIAAQLGFTLDGCTAAPDGNWRSCCDEHDARYRFFGHSKFKADVHLAKCMWSRPGWAAKVLSPIYFIAVSLFGHFQYRRGQRKAEADIAAIEAELRRQHEQEGN